MHSAYEYYSWIVLQVKRSIRNLRGDVTNDLWVMTQHLDYFTEEWNAKENEKWVLNVTSRMRKFEKQLIRALR